MNEIYKRGADAGYENYMEDCSPIDVDSFESHLAAKLVVFLHKEMHTSPAASIRTGVHFIAQLINMTCLYKDAHGCKQAKNKLFEELADALLKECDDLSRRFGVDEDT